MNIYTRNTPRQYLRNGDLNVFGGVVAGYYNYGISGMSGGYLPALPLEDGGYLVEDFVTFSQKIIANALELKTDLTVNNKLNVYGDTNLKNTTIDGDINITGKILVNGEEFKGGEGGGESYLKDLKDVDQADSASIGDILFYDGNWKYINGHQYIVDSLVDNDIINNINGKINDLQDAINNLDSIPFVEYYPSRLNENTHYLIPLKYNPRFSTDNMYYTAIGEVEILDNDHLYKCYVACYYSCMVIEYTHNKYYISTDGGRPTVEGGVYEWWNAPRVITKSGEPIAEQYAIVFKINKSGINRIRARFQYYKGTDYSYGYPQAIDNSNQVETIFGTIFDGYTDINGSGFSLWGENSSVYEPGFLTDYKGVFNINHGNSTLSTSTVVEQGASGLAEQYGFAMQYGGAGYAQNLTSTFKFGPLGLDVDTGRYISLKANGHELVLNYDGLQYNGSKILTENSGYTKDEVYSKSEVYNKTETYSKLEVDTAIENIDVTDIIYTKEEVDDKLQNNLDYLDNRFDELNSELNVRVDSWMIPFTERLNNVEGQLEDIELALDGILGYETTTYLEETLDEILYQ